MEFLKNVKNSIYNPKYYQELLNRPFSYSVKYFFKFSLVFSLLFVLIFSTFIFPKINRELKNFITESVNNYPDELEVSVKNGSVSTNVEEPYFIKTPSSWKGEQQEGVNNFENLIVIDTKSEPDVGNLEKYNTASLITEKYIVYEAEDGKITIQPLEKFPNMVINEKNVNSFIERYSPYLKFIYIPLVFAFFIFAVFFLIFRLIYLFFAALFIWLIASIKGVKINYSKAYQMGMHLMTLPLILISLTSIKFPFAFTVVLLIAAAVNIKNISKEDAEPIANEVEIEPKNEYAQVVPGILSEK